MKARLNHIRMNFKQLVESNLLSYRSILKKMNNIAQDFFISFGYGWKKLFNS